MAKILFINPIVREDDDPKHVPMGMAQLASIAIRDGHEAQIYDHNAWRQSDEQVIKVLSSDKWDLIALGGITFITAVIMSPGGYIADRVNRRMLMIAGTTVLAVCLSAITWTSGFWALAFVCGMIGLTQGFYMPAGYALMVEQGRKMGMGATLGLYSTSLTFGLGVGPLVSGILVDELGLRTAFFISGLLALIASGAVRGENLKGTCKGEDKIAAR